MIVKIEEFKDGYVVVPKFKEGHYGISTVIRGDMSDSEWRHWRKLNEVPEFNKAVYGYRKEGKPEEGLTAFIVDFLTEKGVKSCVTMQPRPLM